MNIFQKIYQYRELLKTNVKKEIRGRYKNSILGVMWSFLNPLLQLAVYAVIFGALLAGGDPTYHIYICVAYHGLILQQPLLNLPLPSLEMETSLKKYIFQEKFYQYQ